MSSRFRELSHGLVQVDFFVKREVICKAYELLGHNCDRISRCSSRTDSSQVDYFFYYCRFEGKLSKSPECSTKDRLWKCSKPESPGNCFLKRSKEVDVRDNRISDFGAFLDC